MPEAAALFRADHPVEPSRPEVALHAVPKPAPPAPRLELAPYNLTAALTLERELGVSHVLAQVLVRRGLSDVSAARAFLHPTEAHDPSAFAGIDRAVGMIERHVRAGSRIVVHGDYDVDGVCATATMVRALRALGADVGWYLPDRLTDGYGLALETVRRLAAGGTALLITVDCAITAVDEVAAARAAGVEVVVCDHHAPRADGRLPDCDIVHPAVCGYPCVDLCGTGVAYKVAQALGAPGVEDDIELVALATVADLMPLVGENRRLVREGLRALSRTARPGLRALMTVAKADPSALDTRALGFRLAPRINAAGRLRRADAGLELLLTDDEQRAGEIAAELDRVNTERRAVEQRIVWEAEAQVAEFGERRAYVLAGEDWHPGVVGIVASRIVERHHRPAVVVALDGDVGSGSARSIPGFDLLGALHATAEHLERYGGHRAAAGMTVQRDRIDGFRRALEDHAEAVLPDDLLIARERVDAIASGCELGLDLAEELELLEPCGMGNPRSRLLVPGARLRDPRPMGDGRHLRFVVGSGGINARAVAFGCDGKLGVEPDEPADATFRLERNFWNGAVEPRLVLGHARPCAPGRDRVARRARRLPRRRARRLGPRSPAGTVRCRRAYGARPPRPQPARGPPRRAGGRRRGARGRGRGARGRRRCACGRRRGARGRWRGARGVRRRAAPAERAQLQGRRVCADLLPRARARSSGRPAVRPSGRARSADVLGGQGHTGRGTGLRSFGVGRA